MAGHGGWERVWEGTTTGRLSLFGLRGTTHPLPDMEDDDAEVDDIPSTDYGAHLKVHGTA